MAVYTDKTVVITGAARGIGYSIAENFLRKSVRLVLIVDVDETQGTAAAKTLRGNYGEGRVQFYRCNVLTDLDVTYSKMMDAHETVDVLVNCAGVCDELDVANTIDVNVTSLIKWSLRFHEHMRVDKSGKGGTIINVASILSYKVVSFAPVYQASKFAVLGFTRSLGHVDNFRKFGVQVIAICPGFTATTLINNPQSFVPEVQGDMTNFLENVILQSPDVVGQAAVDLLAVAESGTAWQVAESQPVRLIKQRDEPVTT